GVRPISVAVGDFNGDGVPDLAVANAGWFPSQPSSVSVLLGNGDGTFQALPNFNFGTSLTFVAVGDFRGNRVLDLVVGDWATAAIWLLRGHGDGTFSLAGSLDQPEQPQSVAVGDFNGDGVPDVAVAYSSFVYGVVSVMLGNGDGTFQAARHFGAGSLPNSVVVDDFNGDGVPD